MTRLEKQSLAAIPLIVLIGCGVGFAGSQNGAMLGPLPLFAACGIVCFGLNGLVFVPAWVYQTERYFDLTGSATYLVVVALALLAGPADPRALLLGAMVALWAARLGAFLFVRVGQDGGDGRFDPIKPSFPRFAMTWTLQGLWVLLTVSCALAAMTSRTPRPLDAFALAGAALFAAGFAIEVAADRAKRRFRADPANDGRFIATGVWAWSRHPNYFGEIVLWCGVALAAFPVLKGWQYATLISPLFVYVLLTRISGIPMLEARGRRRWGDEPAYREYVARTPALVPRPPRRT